MAKKKLEEPERWITVNGQHLPVYPGGRIGAPGQQEETASTNNKSTANDDYRVGNRQYGIKKFKDGRIVVGYYTPSGGWVGKTGTNSMEKAQEILQRTVATERKFEGAKITSSTGGPMDRGRSLDTTPKSAEPPKEKKKR